MADGDESDDRAHAHVHVVLGDVRSRNTVICRRFCNARSLPLSRRHHVKHARDASMIKAESKQLTQCVMDVTNSVHEYRCVFTTVPHSDAHLHCPTFRCTPALSHIPMHTCTVPHSDAHLHCPTFRCTPQSCTAVVEPNERLTCMHASSSSPK